MSNKIRLKIPKRYILRKEVKCMNEEKMSLVDDFDGVEVLEMTEARALPETAATSGTSSCNSCSCCGSSSCCSS